MDNTADIYGKYKDILPLVMEDIVHKINSFNDQQKEATGHPIYEHLIYRIKSEESMVEKCAKKELPPGYGIRADEEVISLLSAKLGPGSVILK